VGIAEKVFKVRGQRSRSLHMCECYSRADVYFNGVASRFACLTLFSFTFALHYIFTLFTVLFFNFLVSSSSIRIEFIYWQQKISSIVRCLAPLLCT